MVAVGLAGKREQPELGAVAVLGNRERFELFAVAVVLNSGPGLGGDLETEWRQPEEGAVAVAEKIGDELDFVATGGKRQPEVGAAGVDGKRELEFELSAPVVVRNREPEVGAEAVAGKRGAGLDFVGTGGKSELKEPLFGKDVGCCPPVCGPEGTALELLFVNSP